MTNDFTAIGQKINEILIKVQKLNSRTNNKLLELKNILVEFQLFRDEIITPVKKDTFSVNDIIAVIESYLQRKRLGKKTENEIFEEWKEVALIRFRNTQSHFKK